ncbi:MAG: TolC family protein, partial [Bacteroidota bacterium]
MTRNIKLSFLFLILTQLAQSQALLSLDEALKTALEKNYAVLIAKNQEQISQSQNNLGNAGLSPTVSVNAAYNFASLNSHQEFNSGLVQDKDGAISKNMAASVNANWTVFDGLKMFAVKKRLEANEKASNMALKIQMENLIYQTILAYNNIIKIKALIKSAEQNLILFEERNNLAKVKYNIGADSKMEYLLAQSNERKTRSELTQLQIQLLNAKSGLNLLMSKSADNNFDTSDSIVLNFNPGLEELKKTSSSSNKSILLSKQNEIQFEQSIKEAQAATIPQIQMNTAYNFTRNQSQAGIVFLNRQAGFNAGLSASWLIFNGNKNAKLVQERKLLFLNQQYNTAQS